MAKLNKGELKWMLILLGFAYYTYYLLDTGKINLFIHPRMTKYIYFSFVVFLLLILVQFRRLFLLQNRERRISFTIFLLPILLGFLVNPQGLTGEVAAKKGTSIFQKNLPSLNSNITEDKSGNSSYLNQKDSSSPNFTKSGKKEIVVPSPLKDNAIVIEDYNFTPLTDDIINSNPNKYVGKDISITGFVFRDSTTSNQEFIIARLMLICCAADAEVTGLLCDWPKSTSLQNDQWIKVTGKIGTVTHKYEGKNQLIPIIHVQNVETASKPKNPYVYPD